jgi:hypothetical protein
MLTATVLVSEIKASTGEIHQRSGSQYTAKRSAHEMAQSDGDSDDGFEQMDIDETRADDGSRLDQDTDQATDQATDDEGLSSSEPLVTKPGTEIESPTQQHNNTRAAPPRRELPFTRRQQSREQSREDADEIAGESDDDEL